MSRTFIVNIEVDENSVVDLDFLVDCAINDYLRSSQLDGDIEEYSFSVSGD